MLLAQFLRPVIWNYNFYKTHYYIYVICIFIVVFSGRIWPPIHNSAKSDEHEAHYLS